MPNKYLNKKAGMSYIQITILILSMFAIASLLYTSTESVLAQERDNGRKVCCEETVTGNTCQDAYPEECSSSFQSIPSKCENSEFCEIGCCVSPENGLCNVRSSKRDCSIMGGLFESEPLCQIDQCEKGCCVFGNQAKWTTYKNCQFEGNTQNKDIPTDWLTDEEHNTEVKCIFSLSKGDQGACVFDSDEEKRCSYISREECVSKTGSESNFFKEYFCSNPQLNTTCTPKDHKECIKGEEDAYWFDSCGNKEDVALDCSLTDGTYCGEQGGNIVCTDINCNDIGRKHGESWCEYDGIIGNGKDPAGSRHVKHICYLGTERIEPCADYRNEICVQEDSSVSGGSFSQASCRANQWRVCANYNAGDDMISKCNKNPDCWVKHIDMGGSFSFDVCLASYPPGFELTIDDVYNDDGSLNEKAYYEAMPSQGICSTATQTCTTTWLCCPACVCIDNCKCHTDYFTTEMNDFCMGLGDCGGYTNYLGAYTGGGYRVGSDAGVPGLISGSFPNGYQGTPAAPGDFEFYEGLDPESLAKVSGDGEGGSLSAYEQELLGVSGAFGSSLLLKMLAEGNDNESSLTDAVSAEGLDSIDMAKYSGGHSNSVSGAIREQISPFDAPDVGGGGGGDNMGMIIGMIAAIIAFIITSSILAAMLAALAGALAGAATPCFIVTHTVDFKCSPWQPPSGGSDCNKCNVEDPPCSEYRCESLGDLCEFINKGSENELCVDKPENSNPPKIEPLTTVITEGYEYKNINSGGFEIINSQNQACVEAYSIVRFGIKVDPFSRCRYGTDSSESYDDMFGKVGPKGDFLLPVHRMDLFFPSPDAFRNRYNLTEAQIEKLGELEYFIKCKTSRGKTNLETYSVKSCVNPGPDLTAPTISERSQPANGAFVKHGIEEQPIRIYVNEPAECRWDNEEVGYNQMSNQLNCEDDIEKYTLYGLPCTTTLTNLQNNSKVYIKCLDQPWWAGTENESKRNPMEEGFEFEVFISEEPLVIDDVRPEEGSIIIEGFQPVSRPLKLSTSGGVKDGKSVCSFKISDDYYSTFPETNASLHVQKLDSLMEGKYNIEFFCQDVAGNNATSSTEFRIQIDSFGPRVVRVYYESGGLKIITTEPAECRYDFKRNFIFENATSMSVGETTEHYADWALRTYYIQCEDEYNNKGAKFKVKGYELS